jgi:hypothetical protein
MKVLGLDEGNSRCWWNWRFLEPDDCPRTRELLCRTVDFLFPQDFTRGQLYVLAQTILDAIDEASA